MVRGPPTLAPMSDTHVELSRTGPHETVLDPEPDDAVRALESALSLPEPQRREAVSSVVGDWPRFLDGWARLGELGRDPVERYACFRVGYHRGLDRLRGAGWRGSGPVPWKHESNRGFLRALLGLRTAAAEIGEVDEESRCTDLLAQCDPSFLARGVSDG